MKSTNALSFELERLRAGVKPFGLHFFPRLRSTNDHAAALRKRGDLYAPAIVLTGKQTAGRGRNTNIWWSGAGSLTVTFVLPIDEKLSPHQLPLMAGLAVRNAVAELTGNQDIQLKWPNDLLFHDRKLAGLLCERVHKADLIGLGVNINPDRLIPSALKQRITNLAALRGNRSFDKTDALIGISRHLHGMFTRRSQRPFSAILREYDQHHALIGRRLTITGNADEPAVNGICQGLDSMGRLLIKEHGQLRRIISGQVQLH